jgi:hypothetical protein
LFFKAILGHPPSGRFGDGGAFVLMIEIVL